MPASRALALPLLVEAGKVPMSEANRYRAYLTARAALEVPLSDLVKQTATSLARDRDDEVRAYAQWIRAWHEIEPFDSDDSVAAR